MVTVVTKVRLLTVVGMRQCVLPSSCPTVVGSWDRKYPFRICVSFSEQLPDGRRQLEPEVSFSDMRQFSDMRWNEHSMSCALWTSLKSSVAVTNG
jgi:hypothetical protein